jgi:hypothetical protein
VLHGVRSNASEGRCVLSTCTDVPIDAFKNSEIQCTFLISLASSLLNSVIRQKVKLYGNEVSCVSIQSKEGTCFHRPEQVKGWSTGPLRAGKGMTMDPFLMPVV